MAQFGAGKNPPWARDPTSSLVLPVSQPAVASLTQQPVGLPSNVLAQPGVATPSVYSLGSSQPTMAPNQYTAQQMGVAQMQTAAPPAGLQPTVQMPQPGIAIPTTLATTQVATISYPAPRANTSGQPQQPPAKQQRVFTGTVTKLHDNFGFVDEDVFFQTSCVKGVIPKVGDRVLVEASYNANMPFKWNAARIQVLPNQPSVAANNQTSFGPPQAPQNSFTPSPISYQVKPGLGSAITPSVITPTSMSQPPPLMGQQTQPTGSKRDKGLLQAPPGGRSSLLPSRRLENSGFRDRDRGRDRDRDRHSDRDRRDRRSPRKRSRSPRRSKSPSSSSRARSPARRRTQARVVPRYVVQVPKISLDTKLANVVSLRSRYTNLYIPSDFFNAAFSWTDAFPLHRGFQLGNPCTFHIMSKEVEAVNKSDANLEPSDADHLYSAKVMLLSMPPLEDLHHRSCALTEDPSDVRDAFQHPTRLIQFLVGMKGKSEPMAIGGPWSPSLDGLNPAENPRVLINTAIRTTRALTGIDLSACTQWYRFTEIRYHRPEEVHKGRLVPARVETVVIFLPDVWSCCPTRLEWEQIQTAYKRQLLDRLAEENKEDTQEDAEEGGESMEDVAKTPTHFSELDPKNMKVADLRKELEARTLSSKGLKSQLIARLTKSLKSEQEKEEQEMDNKDDQEEQKVEEEKKMEVDEKEEEAKKKEDDERRKREERERLSREKKFLLPENPAILVHPSPTAKSGKFECTVMSLSVLLDYRPEDTKEHSFEVSLFSELFNEMLMRDFGYRIYKALLAIPEPKKEEREKDKDSREKDLLKDKEHKEEKDKEKESSEEPAVKKRKTSLESEDKDDAKKDKDSSGGSRDKRDSKEEREEDKDRGDEGREDGTRAEQEETEEAEEDEDHREKDKERHRSRDKDRSDNKSSGSTSSSGDKKRDKLKYYTADRGLLMAFVYFDQTHTGYLLDKDVEDILHTLGLALSRAQVKKLVQKMVSRDTLNYRKLTDKVVGKDGEREGDSKEEGVEEARDTGLHSSMAHGNLRYLQASAPDEPSSPGDNAAASGDQGVTSSTTGSSNTVPSGSTSESSGFVMYNGAMLDITSVMQRLERSEKTRSAVEDKLKNLQEEMDSLKTNFSSSEQNNQKVSQELSDLKKRLRDQKRHTDSAESNAKKYSDALNKSKGVLASLLADLKDATEGVPQIKKEDIKQENGSTD